LPHPAKQTEKKTHKAEKEKRGKRLWTNSVPAHRAERRNAINLEKEDYRVAWKKTNFPIPSRREETGTETPRRDLERGNAVQHAT